MLRGRLPQDVHPKHYKLHLQILPGQQTFQGKLVLELELAQNRNVIWMHGQNLHIRHIEAHYKNETIHAAWEPEDHEGAAGVWLQRPCGPGNLTLAIEYSAAFGSQLEGLYKVELDNEAYVFSHFESMAARQAFPCLDEPCFKAPFQISLEIPASDVAASGSLPVHEEILENGHKLVRFATTRPLPSYLIAFAVGPFDVVCPPAIPQNPWRTQPLPFRGLAAKGRASELHYALQQTPAILFELERYFEHGYPFDKLDLVAAPDFAAGAMENAGLVTFREELLLVDAATITEEQRRDIIDVIAHELAHMWFGNLVTIAWWDDTWLKESFATWLANKVQQSLYPEDRAELSMLGAIHTAMRLDSLGSARQIRQPIESSHDIENAFDLLTYEKGMGLLSMFEHWLGEATFRKGIHGYILKHQDSIAAAQDFLSALSNAAGHDVQSPFHSFLLQPGLPWIQIQEQDAAWKIEQTRFLPIGSKASPKNHWKLPLCCKTEQAEVKILLDQPTSTLPLGQWNQAKWILPNTEGVGYLRWTFSSQLWHGLFHEGWAHLSDREKIASADSYIASFFAGATSASEILSEITFFACEPLRLVCTMGMSFLEFTHQYLVQDALKPKFTAFVADLFRPRFDLLGWQTLKDGEAQILRRHLVEFLLNTAKDAEIRQQAALLGRQFLEGHEQNLPHELVDIAVAAAISEDPSLWDLAWSRLCASDAAMRRHELLTAIGMQKSPELASKALECSLSEELRNNEILITLKLQCAFSRTRPAFWAWLQEHYEPLVAKLGKSRAGMLPHLIASMSTQAEAESAQNFFEPRMHETLGGPRNLTYAIESIELRIAQIAFHQASANNFIERLI